MHVGSQTECSEDSLVFLRQLGVEYVAATPRWGLGLDLKESYWSADAVARHREHVESFGLKLAAMHLPLTSQGIEKQLWPSIMLGTPERDRDIEQVCKCIESASKAGIPLLLYNLAFLPVVRGRRSPGRGGVTYSHFAHDEVKDDPPHPMGPMTADQAWERIDYFVQRVIPVADELGVRMGCHQHDPGMPQAVGYRGVERVLGSVEGVKRFVDLHPSPYHGLNFCQGTIAEMCTDPEQVYDAIRYFGSRNKIFWVHFRNIRGGYLRFDEVFPDEGDVNMVRAMRAYKEVAYDGVLVPDHVPRSSLDTPGGRQALAFCLGYIKALIQAVG
ncbi:MAG TPA: mannonate dehydratase [Anaerolineae bacterium]|nr:mannonate dehydratase [Anaerolineae bacterium]